MRGVCCGQTGTCLGKGHTCDGTRLLHLEQEDKDGSQMHEICYETEQVHYDESEGWGMKSGDEGGEG